MKLKKFLAAIIFISLTGAAYSIDANQIRKAKENLNTELCTISESLLREFEVILPGSNSLSGVQPDAYIGKLFPSVLPHLSVGVNASVTPVNAGFISTNLNAVSTAVATALKESGAVSETEAASFNFNLTFPDKLPYPAASVSARIGGFVLPFDIGLWGVTTGQIFHNKSIGNSPVFDFDYTVFGTDIRYAILEGEGVFPKVSVGAGYQFARQNIGVAFAKEVTINFDDDEGNHYEGNAKMDTAFNLNVDTHTIFGQIQVSKTILVVTPYLGLKALFTTSSCAYNWKYDSYLEGTKINSLSDSAKKAYTRTYNEVGIQTQIFGGVSLNLAFFQTCLSASYNFSSNMFTGSLGMNFKM